MLSASANPIGLLLAACLAAAGCGSPDTAAPVPFEGRLSGVSHLPLDEPPEPAPGGRRGIGGLSGDEPPPRIAPPSDDPRRQRLLGIAQLRAGNPRGAVAYLRGALREAADPGAELKSDLAVALLAEHERHDEAISLVEALDLLEQAVEQAPDLAEARFNRALALEKLHLDRAAAEAWQAYLGLDPEGSWARAGRSRLKKLRTPASEPPADVLRRLAAAGDHGELRDAIGVHRQAARRLFETVWLAAWAADPNTENLELLETVADALEHHTGDPFAAEVVSILPDDARRERLVRGHAAYAEGYAHYEAARLDEARPPLERSLDELTAAGSPFRLWALHLLAILDQYEGAFDTAEAQLHEVEASARELGYVALEAQTAWVQGLSRAKRFDLGNAIVTYRRALEGFDRLGEAGNVAFMHGLVGETLGLLGDDAAWRERLAALASADRVAIRRQRDSILIGTALAALTELPRASAVLLGEAIAGDDPVSTVNAHIYRAQARLSSGHADGALEDVREARRAIAGLESPEIFERAQGELAVFEGLALAQSDPGQALEHLDRAIRVAQKLVAALVPELRLARGRVAASTGDDALALADFMAGVEAYESARLTVGDRSQRISFFDTAGELFDEIVRAEALAGRSASALRWAERARARQLLDRLRITRPIDPAQLRHRLGSETALVYYSLLDDRLLAWTVTNEGMTASQRSVVLDELENKVNAWLEALERREPEEAVLPPAAELYEVLVAHLPRPALERRKIIFVPHKILHAVPFPALYDAESGRHLIQDHSVLVVPGASMLARSGGASRGDSPRRLLAVGDPAFAKSAYPHLPRLSAAAEEARAIAAMYDDSSLLTGAEATKRRFLDLLSGQRVVHFAGHAIANERDPNTSRLLLAEDRAHADDGTLLAAELYRAAVQNVELVVLAACETAFGKISQGEGTLSLAHPFLAGGVPAVVASLWSVDDAASLELFTRFYSALAGGAGAADALRAAQAGMLESGDADRRALSAWAAFHVIGGSAELIR